MAFKMKGLIKVDNYNTPIFHKNLDKGVIAEANKDGSIFLDDDVR